MDGITLSVIRCEIRGYLPLKVQKVQQPGKKELVFSLWSPDVRDRLVLSLEGAAPFFGFSDERKENPPTPPGFCLGLRKRLEGGLLTGIRQQGLDRVIYLDFDGHDDFGNVTRYVLVFDMAGREQNMGLYRDGLLEASIIPSDEGRFEHRSPYTPPEGGRTDIRDLGGEADPAGYLASVLGSSDTSALQALSSRIEGIGKDLARGILAAAGQAESSPYSSEGLRETGSILVSMASDLRALEDSPSSGLPRGIRPAIYVSPKGLVLHVFPLAHLEVDSTFDSALDAARAFREWATETREFESLLSYAEALHRKVLKKVQSRHDAQMQDFAKSQDYEKFRIWAELIDNSAKRNPPGSAEMTVTDYYADPPREVVVPLDPKRSSRDNARAYYQTYAKLARAQRVLEDSVAKLEADLRVLADARLALDRALDARDVGAILPKIEGLARREGISFRPRRAGTAASRRQGSQPAAAPDAAGVPSLDGPDGCVFLVGGNAKQNDFLVTKVRRPGDMWLHAKGVRGAHVLVRPPAGQAVTEQALVEAARLAAAKSGAKGSSKVEVDYVDAGRVRKPRGGAPGFVTYTGQKTMVVSLE